MTPSEERLEVVKTELGTLLGPKTESVLVTDHDGYGKGQFYTLIINREKMQLIETSPVAVTETEIHFEGRQITVDGESVSPDFIHAVGMKVKKICSDLKTKKAYIYEKFKKTV